jgi:hypothetical protein
MGAFQPPPPRRRRRRKLVLVALAALALPAGALAAFVVYTGVNGSGNGSYETGSTEAAITITGTSSPQMAPGSFQIMDVSAVNNDPSNAHVLSTVTGTFSSTPSSCAALMSLSNVSLVGSSFAAGQTKPGTVQINAGALPPECSGGTWSVTFGGTTTP